MTVEVGSDFQLYDWVCEMLNLTHRPFASAALVNCDQNIP